MLEGGRAPRSRRQRGRPPRPCPYKAAAGSVHPAEPGRLHLPRPSGEPEGMRGMGSPEALTHQHPALRAPVPNPAALGCLQATAELLTEGTRDKDRALLPPCRHGAPGSSCCGRGADAGVWDGAGARPWPPRSLSQAIFRLGTTSNMSPRGQAESAAWC